MTIDPGLYLGSVGYLWINSIRQQTREYYTGIVSLKGSDWRYGSDPILVRSGDRLLARVSPITRGSDLTESIRVVSEGGGEFVLTRSIESPMIGLMGSLQSYGSCHNFSGLLFPDGIGRLVLLFFGALLMLMIGLGIVGQGGSAWLLAASALLVPYTLSVGTLAIKWALWGWWDPLLGGRIFMIASVSILALGVGGLTFAVLKRLGFR